MDEQKRCGRDILFEKIIWRRFLHITNSSFIESSRRTVALIFVNVDKPIIGFPSGRRALHNRCRGPTFPFSITNRSSITGVSDNASKKLPTPVEHSKDSIRNSFKLVWHSLTNLPKQNSGLSTDWCWWESGDGGEVREPFAQTMTSNWVSWLVKFLEHRYQPWQSLCDKLPFVKMVIQISNVHR